MVAESCNKSTEAKAFAWFMFARNFGILLGPVIGESRFGSLVVYMAHFMLGGAFANGELLSGSRFFEDHPYLLSTLATGLFCLLGTALVIIFSQEVQFSMPKNIEAS